MVLESEPHSHPFTLLRLHIRRAVYAAPAVHRQQRRGPAVQDNFFFIFLISINQIDLCHTSNISSKGWFIHLFEKEIK